jgi:hypothetical protein
VIKVVDDEGDEVVSGFVFSGLGVRVRGVVNGSMYQFSYNVMDGVFMFDSVRARHIVFLEGLMELAAEPKVDGLESGSPALDHLVVVESGTGLEVAE